MNQSAVRLLSVDINNFKNINHGEVTLNSAKEADAYTKADILGIYGQNGSGKTSFIQSLDVLQYLLKGQSLPDACGNYLRDGSVLCTLKFRFMIYDIQKLKSEVTYAVTLAKRSVSGNSPDLELFVNTRDDKRQIAIISEKVTIRPFHRPGGITQELINCVFDADDVFTPATKLDAFTGSNKREKINLLAYKKIAQENVRSFIFQRQTLNSFREHCTNSEYVDILEALENYGRTNLFVIQTRETGLISMANAMPFHFKIDTESLTSWGCFVIGDGATTVSEEMFHVLAEAFKSMNHVLNAMIPGLSVVVEDLGKQMAKDNTYAHRIELVALRNNIKIPLRYESEGIRKIVSVLQLLIVMFNSPSVTVAIDELDSGVFEYMLGEILAIIATSGKGQLIFTSHNLRPLETIDKKYICFTTTNPDNRFIRMKNIKPNNNLRDVYFHDLTLGGQYEPLYDETNNASISLAFKQAGDYYGR